MVLYLDASALIRLVHKQQESEVLVQLLLAHEDDVMATSVLSSVEVVRAMTPAGPHGVAKARRQLDCCHQVVLGSDLVDQTSVMSPGQQIRSLHSIHLTSAKAIGNQLRALITYDEHIGHTAMTWGLPVWMP